jgi:hypothetical protein
MCKKRGQSRDPRAAELVNVNRHTNAHSTMAITAQRETTYRESKRLSLSVPLSLVLFLAWIQVHE